MAALTIRVEDSVRVRLDDLARQRGESISDVVRTVIDDLLEREGGRPAETPASLSPLERLLLLRHHEVLAAVESDGGDREFHQQVAEVLRAGYTAEYYNEFQVIESELALTDCRLVWEILDMFRVLRASVSRLSQTEVSDIGEHVEHALSFQGFDFNDPHEAKLASYVRYLVDHDRWKEQREFLQGPERGNSHALQLPVYRRLLGAFRPIWDRKTTDYTAGIGDRDRFILDAHELNDLYDAWPARRI